MNSFNLKIYLAVLDGGIVCAMLLAVESGVVCTVDCNEVLIVHVKNIRLNFFFQVVAVCVCLCKCVHVPFQREVSRVVNNSLLEHAHCLHRDSRGSAQHYWLVNQLQLPSIAQLVHYLCLLLPPW